MGKPNTENSKKVAGNAKKAAAKAEKDAAEAAKQAVVEDKVWQKGAKSTAKKEAEADKKTEAARKKAERDALLAEEEAKAPSKPKGTNNPKAGGAAAKKTSSKAPPATTTPARGLDLAALDGEPSAGKSAPALNASGIDDALDALALTGSAQGGAGSGGGGGDKVERHPERRFKAAYVAYEARRMPDVEQEHPGLRRQQRVDLIRKEFERSAENPFNQTSVRFDASREEIAEVKKAEREKVERRLGEKT